MNVLYSICGELGARTKKRARVMGTGHLSEDLIGYDTKGGDALADLFILSDLVKSEVYQLAEHYQVPRSIIDAEPSAGLYEGQTDFGELGFTYAELEPATLALFSLIQTGKKPEQISTEDSVFKALEPRHVQFVVGRYKIHFHKHQAPATVPLRKDGWFE
jgi:NAD+ synthetase